MVDTLSRNMDAAENDQIQECLPIAGQDLHLKAIWHGLVTGRLRIINSWVAQGRCFVAMKQIDVGLWACKCPEAVKRVLAGEPPKAVGYELCVSPSTICTYCKRFVEASCERPRAPGMFAFLARAACAARDATSVPALLHGFDERANLVASIELATKRLEQAPLSPAERDIAAGILEGRSRAEIGAQRGTSARTLANQMGSIYRKLRVSGRRQLVATLVTGGLADPPSQLRMTS